MGTATERVVNGRKFKFFRCRRCGQERADFEVTGVGDREYCSLPDHTPRFRAYWLYGRPHLWLKPWLPRSFWRD